MTSTTTDLVTYNPISSGYLPHLNIEKLDSVVNTVEEALRDVLNEFDGVLCTGLSGIVPASIFCWRHTKQLVVLRKKNEHNHGAWMEGILPEKYVIIDDFAASGRTIQRLIEAAALLKRDLPQYLVMYSIRCDRAEYRHVSGYEITRPQDLIDKGLHRFNISFMTSP